MDIREIPRRLFAEFGINPEASGQYMIARTVDDLVLRLSEIRIDFAAVDTVVSLEVFWFEPEEPNDRTHLDFEICAGGLAGSYSQTLKLQPGHQGIEFVGDTCAPSAKLLVEMVRRISEMLAQGVFDVDGVKSWAE